MNFKKKSCRDVSFCSFDHEGEQVKISPATAYRAATEDLGLAAAAPKKKRIVQFTPHHARAALTVCEAALKMEKLSLNEVI